MYDVVMDKWENRDQFLDRMHNLLTYKKEADFDINFIGIIEGEDRPVYRYSTCGQVSFIPQGWKPRAQSARIQEASVKQKSTVPWLP